MSTSAQANAVAPRFTQTSTSAQSAESGATQRNIMTEEIRKRLVYVEETYAGEYETWQDPVTKKYYEVPIDIVRHWDHIEEL